MAGRAFYRILLIAVMIFCPLSSGFAEEGQGSEGAREQSIGKKMHLDILGADSLLHDHSLRVVDIRLQDSPKSRIRELNELLTPDFSLRISYNNRSMNQSFLENNSILSNKGFDNQFLFTIDITPAVIILNQFALEVTYSSIPDQRNFPNTSILDFESRRIVLNEVNRYSGNALSISTAYSMQIIEGIRVAVQVGIASMSLSVEETVQYHPVDPFVRNYSIVTLPFKKRQVSYSNPFAGLSAEFQLRSVRLSTGYQVQLYELEEVSSTNFYISLGVRFRDLFTVP